MATVIIGCKTPNGFWMEHEGVKVKINGTQSEDGFIMVEKGLTVGITYDVDKSLWDAWRTKFASHPLCAEQFVFEAKSESSAKAQAKETKSLKTGLEQKTPAELEKVAGAKKDQSADE